MPESCDEILKAVGSWQDFRRAASALTKKRKGDLFERLVQFFFELSEEYASQLKAVWLYDEVPSRTKRKLNLPQKDRGVDLLAETFAGDYWTIQAKYRANPAGSMSLGDLGTFGTQTAAVARGITRGLICATKIEETPDFAGAAFDFHHVLMDTWTSLDSEFWQRVQERARGNEPPPLVPSKPRDYQKAAVNAARRHFVREGNRRGKLIMPCGTGKSLMGYWTAVRALKAKAIMVAVPSLDLLKQTFRVWAREAAANGRRLDPLVVCSDESTAEGDIHVADLAAPTTTKPAEIRAWLKQRPRGKTRVVFLTYQSGQAFAKAAGRFEFDVALLDEAHKTAGYTGKSFQHLLYQKNVRIKHRVFMTATERYYDGDRDEITGMNDVKVYGTTYHSMSFGKAIQDGILADYRVVLMAVSASEAEGYRDLIEERTYVDADSDLVEGAVPELTADDLATAVALRNAMKRYRLSHAISFHSRNTYAKSFVQLQDALNGAGLSGALETYRVSSKLSAGRRHQELGSFASAKRALISNARCLTEGVDVPAIDLVLFAQPRQSKVDIVQAVGRALRKSDNPDKRGHVLVPVLVDDEDLDLEEVVEGTGFENLVSVLKAMGTVDGDVMSRVEVVLGKGKRKGRRRGGDSDGEDTSPTLVDLGEFAEAIKLRAWDRLEGLLKPRLTEAQILGWADAHRERTGEWPRVKSGFVDGAPGESWVAIDSALTVGLRRLPGGSSLAQLLASERGVRNEKALSDLTEAQILAWADAHRERTGDWPKQKSGPVTDAPAESWGAISLSLSRGRRGLPGGSSLVKLLASERGVPSFHSQPDLTEAQVLEWADAHRERTGEWPRIGSGPVDGAPGETWAVVQGALSKGRRGLPGGSSLAQLLANERGARSGLAVAQIVAWADAHRKRTGEWPRIKSGLVEGAPDEKWSRIDYALSSGRRGLPGGSSLAQLLASERDVRNVQGLPNLTEAQILAWADAHRERTGDWPKQKSGPVTDAPAESWGAISASLSMGLRGLPAGSSLATLLASERGVRNKGRLPSLTEAQIIRWSDAHKKRTGEWPKSSFGPVYGVPGESWGRIDAALARGLRGLPGGSSLTQLLASERDVRNVRGLPDLTEAQILAWADAHRERTGEWPKRASGPVDGAPGETWAIIQGALYKGRRGLPGGSSLPQLLAHERGVRNSGHLPGLTEAQVLEWVDLHKARTGDWPKGKLGSVYGAPGESWQAINIALIQGLRGLPGGSSLARLLASERQVRHHLRQPKLTKAQILRWADLFFATTGGWPNVNSGPVDGAPGEGWQAINIALVKGYRGLPGGSSIARLLANERGVRNKKGLPVLTEAQILKWADVHKERTGEWPRVKSDPVDGVPGEKWANINAALSVGLRGLPGGSSLAKLLKSKRGR